jgi:hypothetical protein
LFAQGYLLCHYPRFYSRSAVDIPIGEAKGRSGAVVLGCVYTGFRYCLKRLSARITTAATNKT